MIKRNFKSTIYIFKEMFGKCIELNVKLANHFEEGSS